jgi:tRNA pseudouridine(55) synthase
MMVSDRSHLLVSTILMSLVWAVPALNIHLSNGARSHISRLGSIRIPHRLISMSESSDDMIVTEKEPLQLPPPPSLSPPLYVQEGLFAVHKPMEWTSQQVVGKIRWLLEQDAKQRGVADLRTKRRNPWIKIGHGGTLDPLATGVLVIGIGRGTKELQHYLTGSKGYKAEVELGFQTTTLDLDPKGEVVSRKPFDHVTLERVESILPLFRGTIQQTPPIFRYVFRGQKKWQSL